MTEVVLDFEKLKQQIAVLERKVQDLQGAVLAIQNQVYGREHAKETPAVTEGKLLADLDPELVQLIEVYDADGETRVKCKKFIHKKQQWVDIHEYFTERGFKREGKGKDSYWWRKK